MLHGSGTLFHRHVHKRRRRTDARLEFRYRRNRPRRKSHRQSYPQGPAGPTGPTDPRAPRPDGRHGAAWSPGRRRHGHMPGERRPALPHHGPVRPQHRRPELGAPAACGSATAGSVVASGAGRLRGGRATLALTSPPPAAEWAVLLTVTSGWAAPRSRCRCGCTELAPADGADPGPGRASARAPARYVSPSGG